MTGSIRNFQNQNFTPKSRVSQGQTSRHDRLAHHRLIKSNLTDCSDPVFNGVCVFWVARDLSMGTFLFSRVGDILVVALKL